MNKHASLYYETFSFPLHTFTIQRNYIPIMQYYSRIAGFRTNTVTAKAYKMDAFGDIYVITALMNFYLMTNDHPPIIIYDEDKKLYYECLQKYDEAEDLKPVYEFLIYETEKTWKKALELADDMKLERRSLSDFTKGM